jgi:WD40 repeat protein
MVVPNSTNLLVRNLSKLVILQIPQLAETTAFGPNPIFSPDGKSYLSGDQIFSTNSHLLLGTLERPRETSREAEEGQGGFAVDGSRIFSVDVKNNRTTKIWDFGTWRLLHTLIIGGSRQWPYGGYALSPAGALFAEAGAGIVRLWDVATGEQSHALQHPGGIININFSPDGRIIATGQGSRLGSAWDSRTGRLLARYEVPAQGSPHVLITFSPDSRYMAVTKYERGGDYVTVTLELVDIEHLFARPAPPR